MLSRHIRVQLWHRLAGTLTSVRPPIVTIMGHVDHGKTTLLDTLRNSNITEGEFGGITQRIGAFTVRTKDERKLTFIDTPGHAAFSSMRERGVLVTDLVVLVVAVDDGVMPQTKESIEFIKSAKVPYVVALNKIDLKNADVSATKEDLFCHDVVIREYGGGVPAVEISAKKKLNIELLLSVILEETERRSRREDDGCGVVLESSVIPVHGKVASVIVTGQVLRVGDKIISCSGAHGRIRTMFDEFGHSLKSATASTPVQISGFKNRIPQSGDRIDFIAKAPVPRKMAQKPVSRAFQGRSIGGIETQFPVIIKCDTLGSLEAIHKILSTYKSELCDLKVITCDVGSVNLGDVENCSTFAASIMVFNSYVESSAKDRIVELELDVSEYKVIYHLVDGLIARIEERLPPTPVATTLGEAEVAQVFLYGIGSRRVPVAGCRCSSGTIERNARISVRRPDGDGNTWPVFDGEMSSLKVHRDDVKTVEKGREFGLRAAGDFQFKEDDRVICYRYDNQPTKLDWKPFA